MNTADRAWRDRHIVSAIDRGETAASVARSLGLSRERVRQVYTRTTGSAVPCRRVRQCRGCGTTYPAGEDKRHRLGAAHRAGRDLVTVTRFWAQVDFGDDCWEWLGPRFPSGYGMASTLLDRYAHRASYQLTRGAIPKGLTIDHLCRNRACVNPTHLEAVTQRTNVLRSPIARAAINARKTHCAHGHEFTPENTYRAPRDPHRRQCRACLRRQRRAYRKKKAAA